MLKLNNHILLDIGALNSIQKIILFQSERNLIIKHIMRCGMSETENISKMAEFVSTDLLFFFKWQSISLFNTNFTCKDPKSHSSKDFENYTHPVDVVFHYLDPYTNKRVLFNTDLKSYKIESISEKNVRTALQSLAKTIDCARHSEEWKKRYSDFTEPTEIRGLLFAYNHDGKFDREFYDRFFIKKKNDPSNKKIIDISNLGLKRNQLIHIIEPAQINYLNTIVTDLQALASKQKFPQLFKNKHWFHYPELFLHKTSYNKYDRPATIEQLSSKYLVIGYDAVLNDQKQIVENSGYIIYYNGRGDTSEEFIYLLDTISKNQMLDSSQKIKIRCTSSCKDKDIKSNFKSAVSTYIVDWGYDSHKKERLEEIASMFDTVTVSKELFNETDIGWRSK